MSGSASSSGDRPLVGVTTYVTPAKWSYWEMEAALRDQWEIEEEA